MQTQESQSLGEWLRDARMNKDISLRALAGQLDITPSYLSDIENDRRVPAEDVLQKLTGALDLPFDDAMARAGRFGEQTDRYIKRQPEAVKLMRRVSAANLTAEELRKIELPSPRKNEENQ